MVKEMIERRMKDLVQLKKGCGEETMRPTVEAYRGDYIVAVSFIADRENLESTIDLMRGYMPTGLVMAIDANFTSVERLEDAERDEEGRLDPTSDTVEEAVVILAVRDGEHAGLAIPYWTDEYGNLWFMEPFELGSDADSPMLAAALDAVRSANLPVPEDIVERDCETTVGILRSGSPALLFGEPERQAEAEALLMQMLGESEGIVMRPEDLDE